MIRDTIKNHADFAMGENDPVAKSAYFLVRAKRAKIPDDARYGMIVTKKTFKHAVDRNRAKRMLRDWIAHCEHMMCPEWDYVFIIRRAIIEADRTSGRVAMKKALNYLRKQEINAE
ncbi:MAG: ribonuclease P protein component [Alphaproteobacteria bacterium]|nr:ribonuclease P protein component [Alphaproteobacteria bacterium]